MLRIRKVILAAVLMIGFYPIVPVQAAILYVDKDNACPGSGTSASPYCSIQNAVNAVNAGDTIRIRNAASAYSETIQTSKSGTSSSPITVEPDAGHNPRIYNSGNGSACANFFLSGSYWTIQNLNFDATGQNSCIWGAIIIAVQVPGDIFGHKILNNTFKGWGNSTNNTRGMTTVALSGGANDADVGWWPTDVLIQGNTFDTNRSTTLQLTHARRTVIRANEFKGMKCGDGLDATNMLGIHHTFHSQDSTIEDNTFHDIEGYAACTTPLVGYPTFAAYWCDVGGRGVTLRRNTVYNMDQNGDPTDEFRFVAGFFIEAGCEGHTVTNNVFYNIKTTAIYNSLHYVVGIPNVYTNNTIYGGAYGFYMKEGTAIVKNNIIKNVSKAAICHGCGSGSPSSLSVTYNYNLYDDGGSQTKIGLWAGSGTFNFANWKTQCKCDSNSLNTNPLLVSPTSDFHLQSSSPARGAGENGVDIGALPYVSGVLVAPSNLVGRPN
jgi:hypothetical protein